MKRILILLLGIFNVFLAYAYFIEPNQLAVEKQMLRVAPSSEAFAGFSVVHISDLHLLSFGEKEQNLARAVNSLKPHVICLTGDLIALQYPFAPAVRFLNLLEASHGIYVVFGDADYSNMEDLVREFRAGHVKSGITVLRNEEVDLNWKGAILSIAGLDDPLTERADIRALAARKRKSGLRLVLTHAYLAKNSFRKIDADLILAGNTHGGQVKLLPSSWTLELLNRSKKETNAFLSGVHELAPYQYLHVSRGIGMSFLPLRFGAKPEISYFEFRAEEPEQRKEE